MIDAGLLATHALILPILLSAWLRDPMPFRHINASFVAQHHASHFHLLVATYILLAT